jgi:hypothetical protein
MPSLFFRRKTFHCVCLITIPTKVWTHDAADGDPHLEWRLRGEFVKAQRGEKAEHDSLCSAGYRSKRYMLFPGMISECRQAPSDPRKRTFNSTSALSFGKRSR